MASLVLPNDVWKYIFRFLTFKDIIFGLLPVNRYFWSKVLTETEKQDIRMRFFRAWRIDQMKFIMYKRDFKTFCSQCGVISKANWYSDWRPGVSGNNPGGGFPEITEANVKEKQEETICDFRKWVISRNPSWKQKKHAEKWHNPDALKRFFTQYTRCYICTKQVGKNISNGKNRPGLYSRNNSSPKPFNLCYGCETKCTFLYHTCSECGIVWWECADEYGYQLYLVRHAGHSRRVIVPRFDWCGVRGYAWDHNQVLKEHRVLKMRVAGKKDFKCQGCIKVHNAY